MARTNDFIVVFNIVMMILGFILFVVSIYIKQNFADGWASIISLGDVWAGIFAGLLMMGVSILGCYAAKKNKKMYLCMYLLCVVVILTIQIAAAAVLVQYSNAFKAAFSVPSSQLTNGNNIDLNNAVLSLYVRCCSGCPGITANVDKCNNPGAYFPGTYRPCYNRPPSNPIQCATVQVCSPTVTTYCYQPMPGQTGVPLLPTHYIDISMCTLLSSLNGGTGPLVGYVDMGGCGGGNVGGFVSQLDAYFSPKMYLLGVGFAVIAVIQSTVLFVGAYVILCVSKKDIEEEYSIEDAYERRLRRI